jgi:metallo-beta-lactamase family protein
MRTMSVTLSFHGGVETVTGSCHLLNAEGVNILVDCGLFQGDPRTEEKNYDAFGFDPSSLDYLLLTHGHLDHCGRIPVLVEKGFKGKIICTRATYDIAKVILLDTARIQEEDFEHWKKIKRRTGQLQRDPLYTTLEALDSLRYFDPVDGYGKPVNLSANITATFRDAGHIFGSAFIEVNIKGYGMVIFSGDLGNRNKPIIKDPSFPDMADFLVIEGTYSNRNHKNIDESVQELKQAIIDTFKRNGNLLVPAFAIERAQDILYYIREFREKGEIPSCSVFLDSPMALNVAEIMRRNPGYFDRETAKLFQENKDPFSFPGLKLIRTPEESRQINFIKSHAVVIAGSGMCTGGRIKHHLKHNIWRKESSVVFVGYQAEGTLGRKIVDGEKTVKIFEDSFKVNARVYTIGGFSAHADRDTLIDWIGHINGMKHVFLVHGESDSLLSFQKALLERKISDEVSIPRMHESFLLQESR